MANKNNSTDVLIQTKSTGRGGKNNFPAAQIPDVEPGDNSRFLRHALTTLNMPPIDISDEKQVEERSGWYFNHCADNEMKPTVKGLCNAIGISRNTIRTWYNEEYRGATHSAMIKKAYDLLEELWEDYMLNGKINPVSGIFLGRNHWGYQDKIDLVVTPNNGQLEPTDVATIEQKYAELPSDI
jgi:hypothetical protein